MMMPMMPVRIVLWSKMSTSATPLTMRLIIGWLFSVRGFSMNPAIRAMMNAHTIRRTKVRIAITMFSFQSDTPVVSTTGFLWTGLTGFKRCPNPAASHIWQAIPDCRSVHDSFSFIFSVLLPLRLSRRASSRMFNAALMRLSCVVPRFPHGQFAAHTPLRSLVISAYESNHNTSISIMQIERLCPWPGIEIPGLRAETTSTGFRCVI